MTEAYVGVDVASAHVHAVAIDGDLRVIDADVFGADQLDSLCSWSSGAEVVAVDAPATLSTAQHAADDSLPPKFRSARCAEIGLARSFGIWVPWVTPVSGSPLREWMKTGLEVHRQLAAGGRMVIEVYPHAGYLRLAGAKSLPKKQTLAGARTRISALAAAGISRTRLPMWSHDGLDALLAALVAHANAVGTAVPATCGHDGSAIWLPC